MPSPLGHFLAGCTLAAAVLPRDQSRLAAKLALAGAMACVPDLDFVPMLMLDLDHSFHRGVTHSLLFALGGSLLLLVLLGLARWRFAAAASLALVSHGLLDWATTVRGGGVKLLWPFSPERIRLGLVQFPSASVGRGFAPSFESILQAVSLELVIFVPPLLVVLYALHRPQAGHGNRTGLWATIRP